MSGQPYSFVAAESGEWRVTKISAVIGETLQPAKRLTVVHANLPSAPLGAAWLLRGVTSFERYVTRPEKTTLIAQQPPLDRPEATCAALIPVKKNSEWWELPQDERRAIFEERSHHIRTGVEYLPAVARRLHHCYELGEPFDFLTWFEYSPRHGNAFEELVQRLRATEEWKYVVREVDVRLVRSGSAA